MANEKPKLQGAKGAKSTNVRRAIEHVTPEGRKRLRAMSPREKEAARIYS